MAARDTSARARRRADHGRVITSLTHRRWGLFCSSGTKPRRFERAGANGALFILGDQHEGLRGEGLADGNHHAAARGELFKQGRRDLAGGTGDDDGVEGRLLRASR